MSMWAWLWLAVFIGFLIQEGATAALTGIWFAGGALAALLLELLGGGVRVQLLAFVAVSALLLFLVRPLSVRLMKGREKEQGQDNLIGRTVTVKERIDNKKDAGRVTLAGETWLARAAEEDEILEPQTLAVVVRVEGARLFVAGKKD